MDVTISYTQNVCSAMRARACFVCTLPPPWKTRICAGPGVRISASSILKTDTRRTRATVGRGGASSAERFLLNATRGCANAHARTEGGENEAAERTENNQRQEPRRNGALTRETPRKTAAALGETKLGSRPPSKSSNRRACASGRCDRKVL